MAAFCPFFSVIVSTYQRVQPLRSCLRALSSQAYPHDRFEVIVVDDGSTTSPEPHVEAFEKQLNVRLLRQTHSGPAAARNHGAKHAKGTFLAFTDDDCAPSPIWLPTLAEGFATYPEAALGGRTINGLVDNAYSTTSQLVVDYLYTYCNSEPTYARFLASNNLAFPAKRFHAIGGFDASWKRAAGEDRELCDRWICNGFRMVFISEAVVEHFHSLTWRTFLRQHFNYGRGAFYFHKKRATRRGHPIRIERLSFYLRSLRYPFSQAQSCKALLATLILGAQAANAAGFFWEMVTNLRPEIRNFSG